MVPAVMSTFLKSYGMVVKTKKICVGASAGGHLNQLLRLLEYKDMWKFQPDLCVTTQKEVVQKLTKYGTVKVVGECNRKNVLKIFTVIFRTFSIIARNRPDVIISTGSLPLAILSIWGKLFGAKIVWIDSIANIPHFSMSGQIVYFFADLFLTQWPDLAEKHKRAVYTGELL
jgi:UDP-N-acetylglucosamine:LPS N-acetylglucosamine transferase